MKNTAILTHDKLRAAVEKVRAQIREIKAEREKLEDAPPAKSEALARMRRWVDEVMAPTGEVSIQPFVSTCDPETARIMGWAFGGPSQLVGRTGIDSTLCWLFGNLVKERLAAAINDYYASKATEGIASKERETKLEQLSARLLELETEEERLICSGEEAGIVILRRADVDPRALAAVL